jgi:hypothetical protein
MNKMHGLSVREHTYAILYGQCAHRFPNIARDLPKPEIAQPTVPAFYQAPAISPPSRQQWPRPSNPVAPPPPSITTDGFFRSRARTEGCAFCTQPGHRIRECTTALEYVHAGRAAVVDDRIRLPNGDPVPNDGLGCGLKASIDAWLANQPPASQQNTHPFPREPPPHLTLSFETLSPTHQPEAMSAPYVAVKCRCTRADRARDYLRSTRPNRARPGL